MNEFIEKLIGRLEEKIKENTNDDMSYKIPYFGLEIALNIVNELAEEHKGGWIPCSEKQPNKDGYYLVVTSDGEIDVREYDYSKGWGWDGFERIIAWQPLPDPYKQKEGDECLTRIS